MRKKRQLATNTSENRLKELPEIYTEIPADQTGKIKAAENIFEKILKQVPSTPQKMVNVTFDEKTDSWNIEEEWMQLKKNKRAQNLFRTFQNDPKSIFYTTKKIRKNLRKAKMGAYNKDDVFVKLYEQLEDKNFYKNENVPLVSPYIDKKN